MSSPSADIRESDRAYVVEAELPGLKKEDVSMELVNENTLKLSGSFNSEKEEEGKEFWSKERMTGAFRRSFTFPTKLDPAKIKASMENGVLRVEIAKTEEDQAAKKLPIKIE
jgi:HSP20 family protein